MTSLKDEAILFLAHRKLKKIGEIQTEVDKDFIESLRRRFTRWMLGTSNVYKILAGWYLTDTSLPLITISEILLNLCESIGFFTLDIGSHDLDLNQNEVATTKPVKLPPTEFYAWAIKFKNVYGLDLYFIPYVDTTKGFACTVIDPNSFGFMKLGTFPNDIPREAAVNWIANYIESQEK